MHLEHLGGGGGKAFNASQRSFASRKKSTHISLPSSPLSISFQSFLCIPSDVGSKLHECREVLIPNCIADCEGGL